MFGDVTLIVDLKESRREIKPQLRCPRRAGPGHPVCAVDLRAADRVDVRRDDGRRVAGIEPLGLDLLVIRERVSPILMSLTSISPSPQS